MAITRIHKITSTIDAAMDYCSSDKSDDISDVEKNIQDSLEYASKNKIGSVIFRTLNSYQNAFSKMSMIKKILQYANKDNRIQRTKDNKKVIAWHLIQSFDSKIDPVIAHKIGQELAEKVFSNFPVQISTHTNTEHTHNHFIISAWDLDGKKWNNCNTNYKFIRKCSDEICKENGLNILENTHNQVLISYRDSKGNLHYYEPTDRKNSLVNDREDGKITTDDIGSYRNTNSYKNTNYKSEKIRDIIRKDIDNILPQVTSYESLLQRLRNLQYSIKDKKKNGEWLSHITFQPTFSSKGIRDSSLDKDGFYIRTNLEKVISENNKNRNFNISDENIRYIDSYNIDNIRFINSKYKVQKDFDGNIYTRNRTVIESDVILDLKKSFDEISLKYNTEHIKELSERFKNSNQGISKFDAELISSIQFKINCLNFIENKDITTYRAIDQRLYTVKEQLNKLNDGINRLDLAIKRDKRICILPEEINRIKLRIASNRNNSDYIQSELKKDSELIKKYKYVLEKKNIYQEKDLKKFENGIYLSEQKLISFKHSEERMRNEYEEINSFNSYLKTLGYETGHKRTEEQYEDNKEKRSKSEERKEHESER